MWSYDRSSFKTLTTISCFLAQPETLQYRSLQTQVVFINVALILKFCTDMVLECGGLATSLLLFKVPLNKKEGKT